jgi:hypothetical protein
MKITPRNTVIFALLSTIFVGVFSAMAQTGLPPMEGIATDTNTLWVLSISFITPFIVAGIKGLVPKIPSLLLPPSTLLIGIILGLGLQYLGKMNLGWMDMAKAGALAVMIRGTWDEVVQATQAKSAGKPLPTPESKEKAWAATSAEPPLGVK